MNKIMTIARVCHEANRAWCTANGDNSQLPWDEAPEWVQKSAMAGVQYRIDNPNAKEDAQHLAWMQDKIDAGWIYGPVKDAEKKEHPCLVHYDLLPEMERVKDAIFVGVANAMLKSL